MEYAVDTVGKSFLPAYHMDNSVDSFRRPSRWSGRKARAPSRSRPTPEGVGGQGEGPHRQKPSDRWPQICSTDPAHRRHPRRLPAGTVPPTELVTLRDPKEMEPYLKEPMSPGWKSVYGLPQIGQIQ